MAGLGVLIEICATNSFAPRPRAPHPQAPHRGISEVKGFSNLTTFQGTDLIFVHDVGANPETTWDAKVPAGNLTPGAVKKVNWIRDFLPRDLPPPIVRDLRVFYYNHDTYDTNTGGVIDRPRLATEAEIFVSELNTWLFNQPKHNRSLVFVGHGWGGLLVKKDLVLANGNSALRHIVDKAEAILFLGTPHGGVERSRLGRFFCLGRLCQLVDEIGLNSDVVIDLQRDFNAAFDYRLNIVKTDFGLSSFILVGPIDSFTLQDKNRL